MVYILLDLCSDSRFLKLLYLFKVITRFICIVVPILLIVILMIEVMKGIFSSDDAKLNAIKKKAITRIISAIVVFLIPTFVSVFLNLFRFTEYGDCINNIAMYRVNSFKVNKYINK